MSEQAYFPKPGQPVRLALHWDDVESNYIFLQMTTEGIIVAPANGGKKETTPRNQKIYFYPWRSLDYVVWFTEEQKAKANDRSTRPESRGDKKRHNNDVGVALDGCPAP